MNSKSLLLVLSIFVCFQVYAQLPPPPGLVVLSECDEDLDGIAEFDLTEGGEANLIGYLFYGGTADIAGYNITYHLLEDDANNDINALSNALNYESGNTAVFSRIEGVSLGYLSTQFFSLNVVQVDPNTPAPIIACDSNSDGLDSFTLTDRNDEILEGLSGVNYAISFYETNTDALNETNALDPEVMYNNITNPQIIFARVSSQSVLCYSIVELTLVVESLQCEDLAVSLIPYNAPPIPGFNYREYLRITNLGNETITSGSVEYIHDAQVVFNNVTNVDAGNTIIPTSTGFILNFNNLDPYVTEQMVVSLNCPATVSLNTLITDRATYITADNDAVPGNNSSELSQTVIGSWDPNDKMESHGKDIIIDDFTSDDFLFYTIRFQNLGTAPAITVVIQDILDAQLDSSTLRMISASHIYDFTKANGRLTWEFDAINLPSADQDEPNSHGYIHFKIKPNSGYAVGDIIPNEAEIYFDFNEAVITNTWETEFVNTLAVTSFEANSFKLFPNPAKELVTINMQNDDSFTATIYDLQGKLVLTAENKAQLNIAALTSGMYFVKVTSASGEATQKLIIE